LTDSGCFGRVAKKKLFHTSSLLVHILGRCFLDKTTSRISSAGRNRWKWKD